VSRWGGASSYQEEYKKNPKISYEARRTLNNLLSHAFMLESSLSTKFYLILSTDVVIDYTVSN